MKALLVKSPFAGLQVGDLITDAKEIERVLAGPDAVHVIQSSVEHSETKRESDD